MTREVRSFSLCVLCPYRGSYIANKEGVDGRSWAEIAGWGTFQWLVNVSNTLYDQSRLLLRVLLEQVCRGCFPLHSSAVKCDKTPPYGSGSHRDNDASHQLSLQKLLLPFLHHLLLLGLFYLPESHFFVLHTFIKRTTSTTHGHKYI